MSFSLNKQISSSQYLLLSNLKIFLDQRSTNDIATEIQKSYNSGDKEYIYTIFDISHLQIDENHKKNVSTPYLNCGFVVIAPKEITCRMIYSQYGKFTLFMSYFSHPEKEFGPFFRPAIFIFNIQEFSSAIILNYAYNIEDSFFRSDIEYDKPVEIFESMTFDKISISI